MDRAELIRHIEQRYEVSPEYLWPELHPDAAVFRCPGNGKWFGLMMRVRGEKIGLSGPEAGQYFDLLVVKNDPDVIGLLLGKNGYYPAYHMNKRHWISVHLGGPISAREVCDLMADSSLMVCNSK
ncbi:MULTISPECIES: MmcQ/YjbR family DNA-binding protein [unclassified Corynebacterium]|uniref:MmcQ/YjbR family DNA-binding protein n=1 Tax=unclassified Corynebacterium TaxID=2624378 RepID=UPI0029CAA497|nr:MULTISPECIES: MmcQ/YjbR family DNA-binding protein [unclassified Corynebacterium]WPF67168.1 MmcQ/YjbR family DNA-binding protein [Corynebacterium sp. 22KM0430]WPF69657.1 MmcQ/YjbR family DNA-binding protein [Corynebacterium sp. 21KM1197]